MTTKNFTIRDHGASVDTRYTLSYNISDPCDPFGTKICKDLVNLSVDELNNLRDAIDRLTPSTSTDKEAFLTELKRIAVKYSVSGEINTQDHTKNYLNFGAEKASQLIFGYRINRIVFNKPEMTFI